MVGTVSVGIVGLGSIGHSHATRVTNTENGATLVGGMDVAGNARDRFEREFDVPAYDAHEALFANADAVIITTPNRFHEEYAIGALDAGLDVLIEKPLAHTIDSAERIAERARGADTLCRVGFHNRVTEPVSVLLSYLEAGRFGDIYHIEANYLRRRGIPGRGSWFTREDAAGGGALVDIGAHVIDLALYVLDFPEIDSVSGITRSTFGDRSEYTYLDMHGTRGDGPFDVDDSANAFIRCSDGQTIALDVAWAANRPSNSAFVVRGSQAGATLDLSTGELTIYETAGDGAPHFSDSEIRTSDDDPHSIEQQQFINAIATGDDDCLATPDQALTTQQLMSAIYQSSETEDDIPIESKPVLTVE